MRKKSLLGLAVMGVMASLLFAGCQGGGMMPKNMQAFYNQLDPETQDKFKQLDEKYRKMAVEIVDRYCREGQQQEQDCKLLRERVIEDMLRNQSMEKGQNGTRH